MHMMLVTMLVRKRVCHTEKLSFTFVEQKFASGSDKQE